MASSKDCSDWLLEQTPGFTRLGVGEHVGRYIFLGHPAGPVDAAQAFLFEDHPTVDWADVHQPTLDKTLEALCGCDEQEADTHATST